MDVHVCARRNIYIVTYLTGPSSILGNLMESREWFMDPIAYIPDVIDTIHTVNVSICVGNKFCRRASCMYSRDIRMETFSCNARYVIIFIPETWRGMAVLLSEYQPVALILHFFAGKLATRSSHYSFLYEYLPITALVFASKRPPHLQCFCNHCLLLLAQGEWTLGVWLIVSTSWLEIMVRDHGDSTAKGNATRVTL